MDCQVRSAVLLPKPLIIIIIIIYQPLKKLKEKRKNENQPCLIPPP
jgi:hypothetical protein